MNLNQLRVFYSAVKEGSISAAAKELSVTQPAISKALKKLQEYYGINLIIPCGKGITTTLFGDEIFEMAEKIFDLERLLESRLNEYSNNLNMQVNIVASQSFAAYYLPAIITRFSEIYPKCEICVEMKPTQKVYHDIQHGLADIGIGSYRIDNPHIISEEGPSEKLVAICSPEHQFADKSTIHPQDLTGENIINHERGSFPHCKLNEIIKRHNIDAEVGKYTLTSNEAIKQMVKKQIGIALMSEKAAEQDVQAGKLISLELKETDAHRSFYICHHKSKYLSEPMNILLKLISCL